MNVPDAAASVRMSLEIDGTTYAVDLSEAYDLAIAVDFDGAQPHAFGLPRAQSQPVRAGTFVGDTRSGGSCNCETITLNPHGSGTHTECAGHVTRDRIVIANAARATLSPCTLLSVEPVAATRGLDAVEMATAGDRVVSRGAIERALVDLGSRPSQMFRAMVIRTLPNSNEKRTLEYTGTNPPYVTVAAMHLLRELGVQHLVVDLPSVDREDDGGALAAHRTFFGVDEERTLVDPEGAGRTITEMAFVPNDAPDGDYLLDLQTPSFMLDAAPSRPLLMPLRAVR